MYGEKILGYNLLDSEERMYANMQSLVGECAGPVICISCVCFLEYCWVGNVDTDTLRPCQIMDLSEISTQEEIHSFLIELALWKLFDENDCWLENINHRSKSTYYFERHGRSEAKAVREGAKFKA
ncbi:hypothetical protein ACOSP7_017767 [Xanthoceras sorbifolium]